MTDEQLAWRFQHLTDAQCVAGVGSWELDIVSGTLWLSDELYRIFDLPPGTVNSVEDFAAYLAPERRPAFEAAFAAAIRTGTPLAYDTPLRRRDGENRWTRGKGAVFFDDAGRLVRMVGTVEDVTALKETEAEVEKKARDLEAANAALAAQGAELQRLDRLKDEFLSLLSHELRTPLATIQGVLSLLDHEDGPREGEALEACHRRIGLAVRSMNSLVADLLSAAQLGAGGFVLRQAPYAPEALLSDACEEASPLAEFKGVSLRCTAHPPLPVMHGDRHRLIQVLRNLLLNAIRHTPAGGAVRVDMRTGDGCVLITVADTGDGIAPEVRDRLFERFASFGEEDGAGLGLFVVRALIEAHGGQVGVETESGAGTVFTIALPIN